MGIFLKLLAWGPLNKILSKFKINAKLVLVLLLAGVLMGGYIHIGNLNEKITDFRTSHTKLQMQYKVDMELKQSQIDRYKDSIETQNVAITKMRTTLKDFETQINELVAKRKQLIISHQAQIQQLREIPVASKSCEQSIDYLNDMTEQLIW